MRGISPSGLLTFHFGLYQLAVALAGGFVGAYLLRLGFSLPVVLMLYAGLLLARFGLRFVALGVVRRLGLRPAMMLGAGLAAVQFLPLTLAADPAWLVAWLLVVSLAEALYWPVYHAAAAVLGGTSRGRELGVRTAVGALVGVLGPMAGGLLLSRCGPAVGFAVAALLMLLSVLPLARLGAVAAGPIPDLGGALRLGDRAAIATFAADGWMASGLAIAWPMVLFLALGSEYEAFGAAHAAAGLVGAVTGLACGRALDRGHRDRTLVLVSIALAAGFVLRIGAGWSPLAATIAHATGAAVMGLYVPVLMSVVYDRAKRSGAAFRFHFMAEAGWDAGAVAGCLAAALAVWVTQVPALAVLPATLGVLGFYASVRQRPAPVGTVLPPLVRPA